MGTPTDDDVLVYEEGFLTRDDAFIPSENLADSNTHRTLVDRILGLFDVRVPEAALPDTTTYYYEGAPTDDDEEEEGVVVFDKEY